MSNNSEEGAVGSRFAMTLQLKSYCISVIGWWFTVPFVLQTRKLIIVYLSCAERLICTEDNLQLLLLNYEYWCLKKILVCLSYGVFICSWLISCFLHNPDNFTIVILLSWHEKFEIVFTTSHYHMIFLVRSENKQQYKI